MITLSKCNGFKANPDMCIIYTAEATVESVTVHVKMINFCLHFITQGKLKEHLHAHFTKINITILKVSTSTIALQSITIL